MSLSDSIEDHLRSIAALVESLDNENKRAAATGRKIGEVKVRQEIKGEFGEVTVDIFGRLIDVRLSKERLSYINERDLGVRVVAAIRLAEKKARILHKRLALGE